MENPKKAMVIESPEKTEKRRRSSLVISEHLTQLGTALGQKIPRERVALYCRALSDIGDAQLRYAFTQALENLGEFLPSIAQLRQYSSQWRPQDAIQDSRRILERGDKPADWEPLKPGEIEARREAPETIREQVAWVAEERAMPTIPPGISETEWNRRRDRQLHALHEAGGVDATREGNS